MSIIKNNTEGTILIVDDSATSLFVIRNYLKESGFRTVAANNGEKAVRQAKLMHPDIILLDVMMPGADGFETCRRLKSEKQTSDIPVIFMTALTQTEDKIKAFSAGGVDYIIKPAQKEEVLARVRTHLNNRKFQLQLLDEIAERKRTEVMLNERTRQLEEAHEQLKDVLARSEKMAELGQLIAGVGHEIKTPLGAIRSSVDNISNSVDQIPEQLPVLFQSLSKDLQKDFFALLRTALQKQTDVPAKQKRKFKKNLIRVLEEQNIGNADDIADTLADMGVYDNTDMFLPLLRHPDSELILGTAYNISSLQRSSKNISVAVASASKTVSALKSYAHYDYKDEQAECDLTEGIETVLTLCSSQLKHGIEVIRNYGELPMIACYPDELNQVWTNIIHNAIQAMDNKGTLKIDIRLDKNRAVVIIADTGKGIPDDIRNRIFEPFFTTKPQGEGSGLGLDIVRKIIDKHGGEITVESEPGNTVFSIFIPARTKDTNIKQER
ncbi:MAG: response regulator [Desulfobacterales bacterium]|nr:response regulator [Desulfobacterales bacterium]